MRRVRVFVAGTLFARRVVVLSRVFNAILAIAVCLFAAATPGGAEPQPPKVSIEVLPGEITLGQELAPSGQLVVVAHNATGEALGAADLKFLPVEGLKVAITSAPSPPFSGDLVWTIAVTAGESAPASAKLVAELSYAADVPGARTAIATAAATINEPPPLDPASSVKASLAPSEGLIDSVTTLELSAQFENVGRRSVVISGLKLISPPYAEINRPPAGKFTVEPGATVSAPFTLATTKTVVPGTYPLALGYSIAVPDRPDLKADQTVVGKVTIGVPGLSDAMQFLGIPSLLLLPGALTVLAFLAAFALVTMTKQADWKNPGLLVVAVTLSFAYAYIYPIAVARLLRQNRDYIRGYDLMDVAYLWVGSIAIGVAAALLCALIYLGWLYRQAGLAKREPSVEDEPQDILRKLSYRGADFRLSRLRKRPQGNEAAGPPVLALPFGKASPGERWVVSQAVMRPTTKATAADRVELALKALEAGTGAASDTRRQWGVVSDGLRNQEITLEWPNATARPRTITDADYLGEAAPDYFLRQGE